MTARALRLAALLLALPCPARAEGPTPPVAGRVHNLKVLSDAVDDVTTEESIRRSFLTPGMSDADRARALWTAAVKYRHQCAAPHEDLSAEWEAHDPVKIMNVYGYCLCCCSSALIEALNRGDGREARGRILNGHSVPEVRYGDGGAWHMFDASLLTVFPKADGSAASVDEVGAAVGAWYEANPGYRGNPSKLGDLMRGDGWTGWKTRGPALLAACPYYKLGFLPAGTHGWNDTMVEYDRRPAEVYEYGYQTGHRALFGLRPGESLTREAGNRGLHVDKDRAPDWEYLTARAPEKDLAYVKEFFPGYRGGVVGNGVHRYAPDLASGDLAAGSEVYTNLKTGPGSPRLRAERRGASGVAVVSLTSPYVYLGGRVKLKGVCPGPGDLLNVSLSTNNGRTFTRVWEATPTGPQTATIDLGDKVLRRYAYALRVEMSRNAGLDAFEVENDVQHAPRTLPRLVRGANTITVEAEGDPTVATRTLAFRITPDATFTRNETSHTMGTTFENLKVDDGSCWWTGGVGSMSQRVEVPGDLVALRLSAQVRARDAKDVITVRARGDGGTTWREVGRISGPTQGTTRAFRLGDWPAGTRSVLIRFEMTGRNTAGLLSVRIDADYRDPGATAFRPFNVTHRWTQGSRGRTKVQEITRLPQRYPIDVDGDPDLVSVTYAMPSTR